MDATAASSGAQAEQIVVPLHHSELPGPEVVTQEHLWDLEDVSEASRRLKMMYDFSAMTLYTDYAGGMRHGHVDETALAMLKRAAVRGDYCISGLVNDHNYYELYTSKDGGEDQPRCMFWASDEPLGASWRIAPHLNAAALAYASDSARGRSRQSLAGSGMRRQRRRLTSALPRSCRASGITGAGR